MNQFIICRVLDQHFALPILSVDRIAPLKNVTTIPDTINYIMGIMESEEAVLPVVDLSKRFFDQPLGGEHNKQVLVTYWQGKEVGLAVDEVLTIKEYSGNQIDSQLEKITSLNQDNQVLPIKSFIRTDEGLILELDIDHLFDLSETVEIKQLFDVYEKSSAQKD